MEKKNLEHILSKSDGFLFQTLICIFNFAYIMSDGVIQLMSRDAFIIGQQVRKFHFDWFKTSIFRLEKPMGGPFETPLPPSLGFSRVKLCGQWLVPGECFVVPQL